MHARVCHYLELDSTRCPEKLSRFSPLAGISRTAHNGVVAGLSPAGSTSLKKHFLKRTGHWQPMAEHRRMSGDDRFDRESWRQVVERCGFRRPACPHALTIPRRADFGSFDIIASSRRQRSSGDRSRKKIPHTRFTCRFRDRRGLRSAPFPQAQRSGLAAQFPI